MYKFLSVLHFLNPKLRIGLFAVCFAQGLSCALHAAKPSAVATNAAPFYVKIRMGGEQKAPGFIHVFGKRPREPWFIPHHNITRKGLFAGSGLAQKEEHYLNAGEDSSWVDIARLLAENGMNMIEFAAVSDYKALLPSADFTVSFSNTPSDEGLIQSFSRKGPGAGIHVTVDLADRKNIRNDLEWTQEALKAVSDLPLPAGKRPNRFPIQTGCFVKPDFHSSEVVHNEMAILSKLGFSGLTPDPVFLEKGFVNPHAQISYWHLRQDHCVNQLDLPAVRQWLVTNLENLKKKGVADRLAYVSLIDEPSSPNLDHIAQCPHCIRKFPEFLKSQGLQPADFGKKDWSELRPVKDSEKEPKLYYYSAQFRNQSLADFFKVGTDIAREILPALRTTVNFDESLTYHGNLLHRGTDWFMVYGQGALTHGWTEDWLSFNLTSQLCGYHADFLRAACRKRNQDFGLYTILQRPLDTELKAVTEVGHGAKAIFHYNYGPYYTGASDADSNKIERYPSLQRVNHAVGAVEDYLMTAQVPPSKIALHYSHATDIWRMKESSSLYGRERSFLYLILRHLGHPVEILSEDDLCAGGLKDYEFLVLLGSHLKRETLPVLTQWVKDGGLLYVGAGTGERDEFNQPLDLAGNFGARREKMEEVQGPGRPELEGYRLKNLDAVKFGDHSLEVVCAHQKIKKPEGADMLAAFSDGSPAIIVQPFGKGWVAFSGFFPGLGYSKAAALARKEMWNRLEKEGKKPATSAPPSYPEGFRLLFRSLLDRIPWKPPVQTSHPLVEANLLESEKGIVIALANWSGQPLRDVTITIRSSRRLNAPQTVRNRILSQKQDGQQFALALDLDTIDFIVFPARQ